MNGVLKCLTLISTVPACLVCWPESVVVPHLDQDARLLSLSKQKQFSITLKMFNDNLQDET